MASCPTCNKDVDPLRAPSARVVGGRIVAYCSAACASGATATPATATAVTAAAATPAAGVPAAASPSPPSARPAASRGPEALPARPARDRAVVGAADAAVVHPAVTAHAPARAAKATVPVASEEILEELLVPTGVPAPPALPSARAFRARRGRRGLVLMFAGAIIIGGMAIAIVQAVSPSAPAPAAASAPDSRYAETAPEPPRPEPAIEPAQAARAALAALVASDSPRVRRVAAAALARTGDETAVEALAELLTTETSEITRLDIGYALARAGDPRGGAVLAAGLKSSRRDVRADAARLLILLGDVDGAGAKELGRFLDLRSQRLGAAEALARVANPEAVGVLDEIHLDQTASPDDRIRAAIALGRARRGDVAAELRALLDDGRFNAFAAIALAELGDPAGTARLISQLEVASLRVGAAIALRRLDGQLDVAALVAPLTVAIAADKDVARVTAAEAILILTGPRAWAERD